MTDRQLDALVADSATYPHLFRRIEYMVQVMRAQRDEIARLRLLLGHMMPSGDTDA